MMIMILAKKGYSNLIASREVPCCRQSIESKYLLSWMHQDTELATEVEKTIQQADGSAYMAIFVSTSSSSTPPARYFKDARVEIERCAKTMDEIANMIGLKWWCLSMQLVCWVQTFVRVSALNVRTLIHEQTQDVFKLTTLHYITI